MYKVDLHTHSEASPDGGISLESYRKTLEAGALDMIAITDHNRIDFALHARQALGERIIVGEEIMSADGEIIGLFLKEPVQSGSSAEQTIAAIKSQGGLVYIPHPFETYRKGLHPKILDDLSHKIDLIEVCNGRALLQNRSQQAFVWARFNSVAGAASSDAHGSKGLGTTYTSTSELPTKTTLAQLIASGQLVTGRPRLRALLYPKYHRMHKKIRGAQ